MLPAVIYRDTCATVEHGRRGVSPELSDETADIRCITTLHMAQQAQAESRAWFTLSRRL